MFPAAIWLSCPGNSPMMSPRTIWLNCPGKRFMMLPVAILFNCHGKRLIICPFASAFTGLGIQFSGGARCWIQPPRHRIKSWWWPRCGQCISSHPTLNTVRIASYAVPATSLTGFGIQCKGGARCWTQLPRHRIKSWWWPRCGQCISSHPTLNTVRIASYAEPATSLTGSGNQGKGFTRPYTQWARHRIKSWWWPR